MNEPRGRGRGVTNTMTGRSVNTILLDTTLYRGIGNDVLVSDMTADVDRYTNTILAIAQLQFKLQLQLRLHLELLLKFLSQL